MLDGEPVSNHDELMSNFFAQPDALALGKTSQELKAGPHLYTTYHPGIVQQPLDIILVVFSDSLRLSASIPLFLRGCAECEMLRVPQPNR